MSMILRHPQVPSFSLAFLSFLSCSPLHYILFYFTFSSLKRPPVFCSSVYFLSLHKRFALLLSILLAAPRLPHVSQEIPDSCTSHPVFCHHHHFVCARACICVRERNSANLATWLGSYTNWRWSETLHLPLQQLLSRGPTATVRWQKSSLQPQSTWESPELCALTHTCTTGFVKAVQLHFSLHGSAVDLCWLLTFIAGSCTPWRDWAGFNQ